jgi:hypothetical protein
MIKTTKIIETLVTIFYFCIEALLHYNIGKTGNLTLIHFPTKMEVIKLLGSIALFAIASTLTSNYIEHLLKIE